MKSASVRSATYASFDPATRAPSFVPPPLGCDCQAHVYHPDLRRYPLRPDAPYACPAGTMDDVLRMHAALGIERGVIVSSALYGPDNRLMADCISGRPNYRGVAVVDDSVSDDELLRLDGLGVRGARFQFNQEMALTPSAEQFRRTVRRITELGWHVRLNSWKDDFLPNAALLRELRCPVVLDHMAHVDFRGSLTDPWFQLVLDLLKNGDNWWIMLSNTDRAFAAEREWSKCVPFARAFIEAAPDRVVWATDWPHVVYPVMVNDGDLLDLVALYAPEPAVRRAILADNPARLMGFER
jgi:predicted TIM-barrel fold metal-dependent hydrolase